MTRQPTPITIRFDRGLLEHSQALHIRRMRSAVWLYLGILARLPADQNSLELDTEEVASAMGLPIGTVRSWLGHLRKHRYIRFEGSEPLRISLRHLPEPVGAAGASESPKRFFTVAKLQRSLGEPGNRESLESVLDTHDDAIIKRALAGTLAVPSTDIRRSRTALFLYLLKRHAQSHREHDPRP